MTVLTRVLKRAFVFVDKTRMRRKTAQQEQLGGDFAHSKIISEDEEQETLGKSRSEAPELERN